MIRPKKRTGLESSGYVERRLKSLSFLTLLAAMDKTEKDFYPFEIDHLLASVPADNDHSLWLFNTKFSLKLFAGPPAIDLATEFEADIFDAKALRDGVKVIEIVNQDRGGGRTVYDVDLDKLQLWQVVQILSECNKLQYREFDQVRSFTLTHFYRQADEEIEDKQLYGDAVMFSTAREIQKTKAFYLCHNLPHLSPMLTDADFPNVRLVTSRIELPVVVRM